MEGIEVGEEGV